MFGHPKPHEASLSGSFAASRVLCSPKRKVTKQRKMENSLRRRCNQVMYRPIRRSVSCYRNKRVSLLPPTLLRLLRLVDCNACLREVHHFKFQPLSCSSALSSTVCYSMFTVNSRHELTLDCLHSTPHFCFSLSLNLVKQDIIIAVGESMSDCRLP